MDPAGDVFKALADPTRRAILDLLFESDGRTLVELCRHFPDLSRFGVMKHLSVLEAADLVLTERSGREKRHYLNPVPIEQVANRWISRYAARFTSALVGLDEQVRLDRGSDAQPEGPDGRPVDREASGAPTHPVTGSRQARPA